LGWVNPADERPWLSLALLLATGIVGVALLLSVILSYQNLQAALLGLGPIGAALNQGLVWLLYAFAFLLYLIFGIPIAYIKSLGTGTFHLRIPRAPAPPKGACPTPNCAPGAPNAQGIYVAIFMGFVILALIALVAFIAYRTLRALRGRLPLDDVWETREDLGGSPLRDLLASLRRRRVRVVLADGAPAHSVRRIYREVLRVADTVGLGRAGGETPDEYARRLGPAVASGAGGAPRSDGMEALTVVYDQVRYGETEPEEVERQRARKRGEAVIGRLRGEQRAVRGQRARKGR
jgi:hypothetical protein